VAAGLGLSDDAAVNPRDEDDWVGTPPEGRHGRERADPDFWRRQWWQPAAAAAVLFVMILIVLALALL
jgi:hypothetical protein